MRLKDTIYLVISVTMFLLHSSALAGSNVLFFTGGQLYNMCRDSNVINQAACEGYVLGVQDTIYSGYLSEHFSLCFPKGVTPAQLRLQTLKFMEGNPSIMNLAGDSIIAKMLEVSFACKKEEPKVQNKR